MHQDGPFGDDSIDDDSIDDDEELDEDDRRIVVGVHRALRSGPLQLGELTSVLHEDGTLPDDWEAADLDDLLMETDSIWMSSRAMVARADLMLDGCVLTHRVSASEIERGMLDSCPDLGAIELDGPDVFPYGGGGEIALRYPDLGHDDDVEGADENGSFVGPDGWLADVRPGDVVGLRRRGTTLWLERPGRVGPGGAETEALLAAFEYDVEDELGEEVDTLVLDALAHDPGLFRTPVTPVGELLDGAGYSRRGAWVGPAGEDWETPIEAAFDADAEQRREQYGFGECCEAAFSVMWVAWADQALEGDGGGWDPKVVAAALAHERVARAFVDGVAASPLGSPLAFADRLAGRLSGVRAAPALMLGALLRERAGDALGAEQLLERAVLADPDLESATEELAWFAADRGDPARAVTLLRRAGDGDNPAIGILESQLPRPVAGVGRNDPCPCGSGRKFKACCIGGGRPSIEERSGWLHQKLVLHLLRGEQRAQVMELAGSVAEEAGDEAAEGVFSLLCDVALWEGGLVDDYVARRMALLPADEAELLRSWRASRLALWEVETSVAGASLDLRDCRTGTRAHVTERSGSKSLEAGDHLLARVVAVGSQHQIIGMPLRISLRQRESLLELLDDEPDDGALAWWVGRALAPAHVTNYEGEDIVLCRAVLRGGRWVEIEDFLGKVYEASDEGMWRETVVLGRETVTRGFVRREGSDVVVESNSVERFERMLSTLLAGVSSLEVVSEERTPVAEALARSRAGEAPGRDGSWPEGTDTDDFEAAVRGFIEVKEREWVDEPVPALGGLTPRQALDDPTRRGDLLALLREMERETRQWEDARGDGGRAAHGFDAGRLRALLGLDREG